MNNETARDEPGEAVSVKDKVNHQGIRVHPGMAGQEDGDQEGNPFPENERRTVHGSRNAEDSATVVLEINRRRSDMKLKDLKRGEYFTKKAIDSPAESQVWIRGDYDRSTKSYECSRFDDVCSTQFIRADKEVFVDFVF